MRAPFLALGTPSLLLLFQLLSAPILIAQGTGASVSVLATSGGAPVTAGTVTVRHDATGFSAQALTSSAGRAAFNQLPLGTYSVTVERIGLRTETRTEVELMLGGRVALDMDLEPAPIAIEPIVAVAGVEVRARAPVNTRIAGATMRNLPAQNRNFTDLSSLAPTMGADFSLGGMRTTSTNIQIDGLQSRNMLRGGELGRGPYTVSMEAVREFEVITNEYDVSEGRSGGGLIRAATQFGTDEVRGSLFVFHRNEQLGAAKDYLGRGRDLRQLDLFQWGGGIGGPIIRGKLHYFIAGDRQDSSEPLAIADLRTDRDMIEAQVAADSLTRFVDILRTTYGLGSDPQVGVFSRKPIANTLFGRLDWTLNRRHRLTLRHNYSSFDSPYNGVGDQYVALFESRSSAVSRDNQTLLSLRSSFGSLENEARLGVSFSSRELTPNSLLPRGFVRVRSALPDGTTGDVRLQFGGNRLAPEASGERQLQLLNTTYWQRGNQRWTFGIDNSLTFLRTYIPTDQGGLFEFTSLATLATRTASRYARQVPISGETRARQYVLDAGAFIQAEWSVTPRVTATLGVRYDVSSYLTAAPRNAQLEQVMGLRTDHAPTDWDNIQPRAQVVWERDRDVLRIGGGAFTAQPHYYLQANNIFFSGTQLADLVLTGGAVPQPDFVAYRQDLASVPGVPTGTTPPAYINLMGEDFGSPTTWKTDVSYQRLVVEGLTLSASALYARTTANYQYFDRNLRDQPSFTLANEAGRAVFVPAATITAAGATSVRNAVQFTQFTNVLELVSTGETTQRALVLQADVTPPFGGHLTTAFTFNRTIDNSTFNCCIARTASLFTPVKNDPRDVSDSEGPSDFNFAHKLTVYGELPGWNGLRVGARYVGSTGRPFSLVVNGDINGDGYSGNDLAFVFDPNDPTTPPPIAASMQRILDNEQSVARDYIRESLGRIADRNGGHAPWVGRMDVRAAYTLPTRGHAVELTADIFNFANLLNSDWGGQALLPQGISASNPISQQLPLLNVVGFDQLTQTYSYTVNENVGVLRTRGDPFQIQVGLRYAF
ncbi:MAG: carboxypeptidase regulatory-like domain-containing protein [Longimicrobiales bacterium]